MKYILSPQAQESLRTIHTYTLDNHGSKQTRIYLTMLRDAMRNAATDPNQGKACDDIKAGYHVIRAGKHHIYYRIRGMPIDIIDVLHQRMMPKLHI